MIYVYGAVKDNGNGKGQEAASVLFMADDMVDAEIQYPSSRYIIVASTFTEITDAMRIIEDPDAEIGWSITDTPATMVEIIEAYRVIRPMMVAIAAAVADHKIALYDAEQLGNGDE